MIEDEHSTYWNEHSLSCLVGLPREECRVGSSWDTRAAVLFAERAANRFLDRTKLGVGIIVESRRSTGDRVSTQAGSWMRRRS